MQDDLVSVVIPNYNYAHYLNAAIDSVLAQTYSNIEVIVVDDGSTDGSRDILGGYADRITPVFQQNQGVSAARNNGVARSRGKYVAFLDADDEWLPAKIEKQIEKFAGDEKPGLVHVGVIEVDAEGNRLLERLEGVEGKVAEELVMLKRESILAGGSGIMVPRTVLNEAGGFDLRLSTSADWDLFYRISSRYSVRFVPELLIKYRVHASNMHSNVSVMEHDMTIALEKAFKGRSTSLSRKSYGNLYKTLAGSYFRAGNYASFIRTAIKSLVYQPANLLYFVQFPVRKLKAQ